MKEEGASCNPIHTTHTHTETSDPKDPARYRNSKARQNSLSVILLLHRLHTLPTANNSSTPSAPKILPMTSPGNLSIQSNLFPSGPAPAPAESAALAFSAVLSLLGLPAPERVLVVFIATPPPADEERVGEGEREAEGVWVRVEGAEGRGVRTEMSSSSSVDVAGRGGEEWRVRSLNLGEVWVAERACRVRAAWRRSWDGIVVARWEGGKVGRWEGGRTGRTGRTEKGSLIW